MARRTRRELDIADHLWDCLTRIAEDCGTDRHAVVNQAVYEFARRFNFLTPMAKEVPPPDENVGPGRMVAGPSPGGAEALSTGGAVARTSGVQAGDRGRKVLYILNGAGDTHKIDKDTFIIGRSRTCDLVIPSSKVSRQHSGICRENGEYYIEDLGSANGVWKDGVKIQKERILDGDEFMISEEVLKFVFR
ncbi:MAG: FHA domain-containing protein [Myxococcales bacterium]|nr:FHA domain-containing protein [Myxococcales bacterium]